MIGISDNAIFGNGLIIINIIDKLPILTQLFCAGFGFWGAVVSVQKGVGNSSGGGVWVLKYKDWVG